MKNKKEVAMMGLYEFDEELHNSTLREEGYEDGRLDGYKDGQADGYKDGRADERAELIKELLAKGFITPAIADKLRGN